MSLNNSGSEGLHRLVQRTEAQVGDKGSSSETGGGDRSEPPNGKDGENRADEQQAAQHSEDGGGEEAIGGGGFRQCGRGWGNGSHWSSLSRDRAAAMRIIWANPVIAPKITPRM